MSFAKHVVRLSLVGLVCSFAAVADAAEAEAKDKPAGTVASAEEIADLVQQLDADQYSQREAATKRLMAIGKPAVSAVSKAAVEGSLEVTGRAIDILKNLYGSSDETTKKAAEEALQKLADGDHRAAARRAKDILKPKQVPGQGFPGGGIILGGANIQIQVAGAANGKKVSIKTVNGVKTIEAEEKDKKIKIVDDPKQGIKMEITTKKDGKEQTEKIEAKNAEELKKKNKEAYELYKEYSQQQAGVAVAQIQFNQGNLRRKAIAIPAQARMKRKQVDMAALMLRSMATQITRLTGEDQLKDASKESIAELKKQLDEVKSQIAELDKRIDARGKQAEEEAKEEKSPDEQPK
ncbi:MAG: hypothetical protein ISR77_11435 [Pirellulaceae bacterium]|nr:hypothetical protein [Pirellulaceae bacterium]